LSNTNYPYYAQLLNHPNAVVRDANGNVYGLSKYVQQEMANPLAYVQTQMGNYSWSHNIIANAFLEIKPIEGLTLKSTISGKLAFYGSNSFTPIYYLSPSNSNLNTANMYRESDNTFLWLWENTANYNLKLGNHNFTILAGQSSQQQSGSGLNVNFIGLPVNNYQDASPNFALTPTNRIGAGFDNQPYTLQSFFGRINYDYNGRYLVTAIVRRDGSSKFGPNNKYGTFPSLSIGWVPSKESFWPTNNVVDYLKIRGSWGKVGNEQSLGSYYYISTLSGGANYPLSSDGTINIGYRPNAPANPDLKWEQTTQTDVGIDINFLKRFNLTFDWFRKVTSDMLLQVQVPGYVGAYGNPYGNIASLRNKGFEIELGYNNNIGDFNYRINGNASYVKNMITDLGQNEFLTAGSVQSSSYEIARTTVGQPIGAFYGFETNGVFQNQQQINDYKSANGTVIQPNAKPGDFIWKDLNGDGVINDQDRTFLGNPTPTWTYGITISANYKNFDIVALGQGAGGNKVYQALRRLDIASANYSTAALNRWTGEGTSNDYPRLTDTDPNHNYSNPSNFYLSSGNYFRLKNLQLGYTFRDGILGKAGITKLRVYLSGNNLVTFTKYAGYDPEIGGSSYGIDRGVYPQAKSYILGASVNF
jgi:TonB-dependent starch-binding outer membrane protein SusC